MWPEAVQAARVEHQAERDGWAANLKAVEEERDWALDVATRIQNDLDLMTIRNAELETAVKQALDAAAKAPDLMSGAEARAARRCKPANSPSGPPSVTHDLGPPSYPATATPVKKTATGPVMSQRLREPLPVNENQAGSRAA